LNILAINKFYWKKGGSEAVFFSEKQMLEKAGHQVIPFSMSSDKNEESEYSKYFVDEVDYGKGGMLNKLSAASKIIYSFNARSKMKQLLSGNSPELAHFHIFQHQISPSVFGPLKAKKIPIILTLHDLKPICPNYKFYVNNEVCEDCSGGNFYHCFTNRCTKGSTLGSLVNTVEMYLHYALNYYQSVNKYIAVSRFYKQKMIDAGFAEDKIAYLPNYIDSNQFEADGKDNGYMLYFGRLSEEKGIGTYINSASQNRHIPYYIVGTGPLEQDLRNKAKQALLDNVHFLGFKQGSELKTLLSHATCVVVPSEWYENCPMTILEAHASGRPVIGANIGGIPELIDENIDGLIFPPGDTNSLSEKINWVWDNRVLAKEMGKNGRKKIEVKFNAQVHYDALLNIYRSVLK